VIGTLVDPYRRPRLTGLAQVNHAPELLARTPASVPNGQVRPELASREGAWFVGFFGGSLRAVSYELCPRIERLIWTCRIMPYRVASRTIAAVNAAASPEVPPYPPDLFCGSALVAAAIGAHK